MIAIHAELRTMAAQQTRMIVEPRPTKAEATTITAQKTTI
jgi:hypothetical protein